MSKLSKTAITYSLPPNILKGKGRGVEVIPINNELASRLMCDCDTYYKDNIFTLEDDMYEYINAVYIHINSRGVTEYFLVTPL